MKEKQRKPPRTLCFLACPKKLWPPCDATAYFSCGNTMHFDIVVVAIVVIAAAVVSVVFAGIVIIATTYFYYCI